MSERRKTSSYVCGLRRSRGQRARELLEYTYPHETEEPKRSYRGVTGMEAWPPPKSLYWDYATLRLGEREISLSAPALTCAAAQRHPGVLLPQHRPPSVGLLLHLGEGDGLCLSLSTVRYISPTGLWVHMQAIGLLYGYKEPIDTDPYDHHLSLVFVSCNLLLPWVAGRLWMP